MIVLLSQDLDATGVEGFLQRARDLGLDLVCLEADRGRAYEVVGADRGRALQLLETPGVERILSRRQRLAAGEPLWPHFALRIGILALLLISALALLAVVFPPPLLDPVGTPTAGAAPPLEWYLRPPAAFVELLPRAGALIMSLWWIALLLWPFIDRIDPKSPTGRVVVLCQRILTLALLAAVVLLALAWGEILNAARLVPVMMVLSAFAAAQEAPPPFLETSCATACHGAERTALEASVHARVVTCVDCHGGDPDAHRDKQRAHAEEAGFRGTPDRQDVPGQCAECHADPVAMFAYALPTDQLAHYRTSPHGRALLEQGETAAATCTDCHGVHGILAAADPRALTAPSHQPETCGRCHADAELMDRFGLPTDMVDRFKNGVHGRALLVEQARGAPSCSGCHGAHGATPPGVQHVGQVCSQCHPRTGESFQRSAHFAAGGMDCATCHEEQAGRPGYRLSECAACHGAHDIEAPGDETYLGDAPGACGHCHRSDDRVAAVVDAVISGRRRLQESMARTLVDLDRAKHAGLFVENEAFMLRESRSALVSLEPLSHSLDTVAIEALVADGIERQEMAREAAERQKIVLRDRRILVGVLVLVLMMLAGLMSAKLSAVRRLS